MSDKEAKKKVVEKLLAEIRLTETSTLNFVVPNFLSKTLRSYMLIREDLIYARDLINRLIDMKKAITNDSMIETSLWQSAVTTYAKNFTQNKAGMIKLEERECFNGAKENVIKTHREIIQ